MNDENIVMLYSGGSDSMLMLKLAEMAGKKPYCVLVDYGQKHVKELEYAKNQLEDAGVRYQVVKVDGLNIDSGLTGTKTESRWDNVHSMNVPARNTIFIGLAYSVAENMGIDEVWYGPDYSDRENLFPDCYQSYVYEMNKVLAISGVKPIKLVAPLLGMTKELILQILDNQFDIKLVDMYSGYEEAKAVCTCKHGNCDVDEKNCLIETGAI
ncbi:MAG: 7-cyano-7-deazaguanine synthase [Candidatus Thorarchaeota archaeon]